MGMGILLYFAGKVTFQSSYDRSKLALVIKTKAFQAIVAQSVVFPLRHPLAGARETL
jgi:hypothetical protein